MTIRFVSDMGEFLLRDPEVSDSSRGPYFHAFYSVVLANGRVRPMQFEGHFHVADATLIEPMGEQLELGRAA